MTALESIIKELQAARRAALTSDESAKVRFANLVLSSWHTIEHALKELNARRIA